MSAKRGEEPVKHDVYGRDKRRVIDREITDQSIEFVQRKASGEQPFFVFLSYTQTHEPVDPHPDYYGKTGHGSFADVLAQQDVLPAGVQAMLSYGQRAGPDKRSAALAQSIATLPAPITQTFLPTYIGVSYSGNLYAFIRFILVRNSFAE